jgi:hypothetical protein
VDGGSKLERTGDLPNQLTVTEVVEVAKKYKADLTPDRQIRWVDSIGVPSWIQTLQYRPSVLDALILEYAPTLGPSYISAAQKATGWNRRTILGFLQVMLIGRPIETATMNRKSFNYWKGVIIGVMVYGKLRRH